MMSAGLVVAKLERPRNRDGPLVMLPTSFAVLLDGGEVATDDLEHRGKSVPCLVGVEEEDSSADALVHNVQTLHRQRYLGELGQPPDLEQNVPAGPRDLEGLIEHGVGGLEILLFSVQLPKGDETGAVGREIAPPVPRD